MWQDLRHALRALLAQKVFSFAVLLTFALGIGATAAIFSVVYGVLLRPLPYPNADRLVRLAERHAGANAPLSGSFLSNLVYEAWQPSTTIGPIGTWGDRTFTFGFDVPTRVRGAGVSAELFGVLQVSPAAGRFFVSEDALDGAAPVIVLSDALWRERFGGDPAVVGSSVIVDGRPHLIIGIAPPNFAFPQSETRAWVPTRVRPPGRGNDVRVDITRAIARLHPGATAAQAAAEGTAAARRNPRPFVAEVIFGKGGLVEIHVQTLVEEMTAGIRPALLVLLAGVACLLLVGIANVANLFLSRGISREREVAVRLAIGASSARVARQLLTESLLLALVGGALGLALAWALIRILPSMAPDNFPRLEGIALDWRVALVACLSSIVAGALSGLVPALRGARPELLQSLREGVGASSGARTTRLRRGLLIAEAAAAVTLLVGASLLVRSFTRLVQADTGFDASNVMTARIYLPGASVGRAETGAFLQELLPRVRALSGVVAAGASNMAPFGESTYMAGFGMPIPGRETIRSRGLAYRVSPGYAEALGLRLRAGRFFDARDETSPIQSMVVNEEFARTFLAGIEPIGLQFPSILRDFGTSEIVGVVENVLKDGPERGIQPEVYVVPDEREGLRREINLILRSTDNPLLHTPAIRQMVRQIRPDAAVDRVATLRSQLSDSVAQPRFAAAVLAAFAGLALALAAIGLYGVLSYTVSRRQREIGVRAALGASRSSLVRLVFREGLGVTAVGLVLGLVGAALLTRLMQTMLFGVHPLDATSFLVGPALLLGVAVLACVLPARRAASTDPLIALRCE